MIITSSLFRYRSFITLVLVLLLANEATSTSADAAGSYKVPAESLPSGSYLAGRSAAQARESDIASAYFTQALREAPNNPALIERVFLLDLSDGEMANAEEFATRMLNFDSRHRMANLTVGIRNFRLRDFKTARKHFESAAYLPLGELTSALLSAWAYAGENNFKGAMKSLDKIPTPQFSLFKAFHVALIADFFGDQPHAESAYKAAYESSKTSLSIVEAYGNFLERHDRKEEANHLYRQYLQENPTNLIINAHLKRLEGAQKPVAFVVIPNDGAFQAIFSLASAMTDDQNADIGILYARLAGSLGSKKDQPQIFALIGDLYEAVGSYEKAAETYEKTPSDSPLRNAADIAIALDMQKLKHTEEAQAKLTALLSRVPNNVDALIALGNIYHDNKDNASAEETYGRAIALIKNPTASDWRVFYNRGAAYEQQKKWPQAEADLRKALELMPNEPQLLNYLGYSMIDRKINLKEGLDLIKKAVELRPNDGYITDSLGWAFYQLKDYQQAVVYCERAVDLVPEDPTISDHLGDVYWHLGRKLEAKFLWQRAKDNKPEDAADLARIEQKLKDGLTDQPPVTPAQTQPEQGNKT